MKFEKSLINRSLKVISLSGDKWSPVSALEQCARSGNQVNDITNFLFLDVARIWASKPQHQIMRERKKFGFPKVKLSTFTDTQSKITVFRSAILAHVSLMSFSLVGLAFNEYFFIKTNYLHFKHLLKSLWNACRMPLLLECLYVVLQLVKMDVDDAGYTSVHTVRARPSLINAWLCTDLFM